MVSIFAQCLKYFREIVAEIMNGIQGLVIMLLDAVVDWSGLCGLGTWLDAVSIDVGLD